MPTFRMGYSTLQGDKNLTNLFGFQNFNNNEFDKFLVDNNMVLVYKLHPNEEPYLEQYANGLNSENSLHLSDRLILEAGLDLYDLLNSCDLMMTDYSGIYFDYLLLNRPMIFIPIDLEDYEHSRGFLFGPYEEWTPGPKVVTQGALQEEILKSVVSIEYYRTDRERLKNIIHKYHDNKSSERVGLLLKDIVADTKCRGML